jgi:SNF2 family DNA or RNA helicase
VIVTFWKGVFVADTLDEREALKKAGFELHEPTICNLKKEPCKACKGNIGRRWWTVNVEAATRLRPFCNARAIAVMRNHLDWLARSRATDAKIDVPSPPGLHYLPYQKAGIAYALQRKDTLIADEPGLGKTIQFLGFVNFTNPKNVIVICPRTLTFNWRLEAERWLTVPLEVVELENKSDRLPDRDGLFAITNYEKLVGKSPLAESLNARQWDVMGVDEAQYVKNPESARSQAVIGTDGLMRRSRRCLFLTGTPIENYPKEIWPVASAICPAKFGDRVTFENRYCGRHLEERNGRMVWVSEGATHLPELQQRLRSSLMVRRLKRDVLPDLPPKRRQLIVLQDDKIDWSKDPRFKRWQATFDSLYDEAVAKLESAKTETEYRTAARSLEKVTGVKFEEMSEVRHELALAKLPTCLAYLDEILKSGLESLVVFAHHRDVIDALEKHFGDSAVVVHGSTPHRGPRSREEAVRAFQEGRKKIFIGQTRAAGVGLTLTAASTIVFVEIDWVPGVLTQCEDRLCRIGQKKMVHVIHLVLRGTIEVNMVQKILAKQDVIDKALDRFPDLKLKAS